MLMLALSQRGQSPTLGISRCDVTEWGILPIQVFLLKWLSPSVVSPVQQNYAFPN